MLLFKELASLECIGHRIELSTLENDKRTRKEYILI